MNILLLLPLVILDKDTECRNNMNLPNGQIWYFAQRFYHLAKLTCDPDYEIIGSAIMYCHANGNWQSLQLKSQFPTCRGIFLYVICWALP